MKGIKRFTLFLGLAVAWILPTLFNSCTSEFKSLLSEKGPKPSGSEGLDDETFTELPDPGVAPSALGTSGEWPKVTYVGAVANDILEIRVQTGFVTPAQQNTYVAKEGDKLVPTTQRGVVRQQLFRDGQLIGYLVGSDDSTLFSMETVTHSEFEPSTWELINNISFQSDTDPHYSKPQAALAVERKTRPIHMAHVANWVFDAPLEHIYYFKLRHPLNEGSHYQIELRKDKDSSQTIAPFTFDSHLQRSEAVHISQIGFRPDDLVKVGYVSTWMGSGGGVSYDGKTFRVIEVGTNSIVFSGTLETTIRADQDEDKRQRNYNKTDAYKADFSALKKVGKFRLCVDGVGCSFSFEISNDVWKKAFQLSMKGIYNQRRSVSLGPPYTDFKRPRNLDPRIGVKIYQSTTPLMDTGNGFNKSDNNFDALVAGKTDELCTQECWGGLMDAGDWDSRIQHLIVTTHLVDLLESNKKFFDDLKLKIPEEGNDLPDILDEALFNLDHYRRMQLPDGGVRGGVESSQHPLYGEASWQESLTVIVYAPGIWSSYLYAAAAARVALVLRNYRHEQALDYLKSAQKAWTWAEQRWTKKKDQPFQVRDARNYAAAALYRLTGLESPYHQAFLETTVFTDSKLGGTSSWDKFDQREANWVYLNTNLPGVNSEIRQNSLLALQREADRLVSRSTETGFSWAQNEYVAPGWGTFSAPLVTSVVRMHTLTKDEKYLRALVLASQSGAGANPLNLAYTTGLGERSPQVPLHVDSHVTNQKPPEGLTLFGPIDGEGRVWLENGFISLVNPYVYPEYKEWPVIETFWDMFWFPTISEYTVEGPLAPNLYVWGYLAAR